MSMFCRITAQRYIFLYSWHKQDWNPVKRVVHSVKFFYFILFIVLRIVCIFHPLRRVSHQSDAIWNTQIKVHFSLNCSLFHESLNKLLEIVAFICMISVTFWISFYSALFHNAMNGPVVTLQYVSSWATKYRLTKLMV